MVNEGEGVSGLVPLCGTVCSVGWVSEADDGVCDDAGAGVNSHELNFRLTAASLVRTPLLVLFSFESCVSLVILFRGDRQARAALLRRPAVPLRDLSRREQCALAALLTRSPDRGRRA